MEIEKNCRVVWITEKYWESGSLKFQEPQTAQRLTSREDLGKSCNSLYFYSFAMLY